MTIARTLTIAGSAAQGSAGIQADLKTFQERDVYGMSAITAIVANNAKTEQGIFTQPLGAIEAQIYAAFEHVGVDALKTGMLFTQEIIDHVSAIVKEENTGHIVVDPVMIGKMGSQLLRDDAIVAMKEQLFPLADIITPNTMEAAKLLEWETIDNIEAMYQAAKELHQLGPRYVLVKGGALADYPAVDILYDGEDFKEFRSERIDTIHTSGAGCTYAAAITAELAKGQEMKDAVGLAKSFVTEAIRHALSFERGIGSTNHAACRNKKI
ncbi:hydroxymethylpyrimidine/phosphomethylpyrimidine kinase [Thalassobacillus devorans]|uniref:Hydroxymethylpyrimidine/phosphomethylpyrimidine kinase n=1 Tax=Thalassobacillus devorans TaxID=279813 RepID=A0ABQ1PGB4_9BACI|nr:bifunctional hydroxymethylpyrimidine kinase/phosphomethylpyrimidine kinase [Thalassobacillus devorans]NIK29434.1 pyridoxine kinase/hydroxymethylpyrimidine/phosphomethylpyrimidine kinase [Thalassobacillus devorans]GGC96666.1 hydroxymethylpyrimidine/phosphomethylpyrimidine kinase [Thalassobacillus devorans]